MLLFIVAAAGIAGSVLFGVLGLDAGHAGELERIFALMCFFMAAAAMVGVVLDDGIGDWSAPPLTRDQKVHLLVGLPVAVFMLLVFLATLIPAIYVLLPIFAARRVILYAQRPGPQRPGRAHGAPAYA